MPTRRRPIDATPVSVKTMVTWSDFTDQLQEWPLVMLRERANQLVEDQLKAYRPLGRKLKRDLEQASDDEVADELILVALKIGVIHAYVSFPPSENCYKVEPFFWDIVVPHTEAIDAIREGTPPTDLKKFAEQTLERDLANRPLFIDKPSLIKFLKLRPPSLARLKTKADEIIKQHKKRASAPMRKLDFIANLIRGCPGCTKNRAEQIWSDAVPPAWRRPGRRKHP